MTTKTLALDLAGMRAAVAELLDLAPEALAGDEDLLGLGVDSIQVMRLAGQWRRAGADVTYAELVELRTLAQWWHLVSAKLAAPVAGDLPALPEVDENEPFDLAPLQHAYWVGRGDEQRLGGVGAQFYCEFDGAGVRTERLEQAVRALAGRHGMLRARFLPDGRQQIPADSTWPGLTVHDLRGLDETEALARAGQLRDLLAQRRMAADAGQVLDVHLSLLPGGRTRVHLAVEMLVCDAQSFQVLLADLAALYVEPGAPLPPLDVSYPRYRAAVTRRRRAAAERDRAWWQGRLDELPGAPRLPLAGEPGDLATRTHRRRGHTIPARDWARLSAHARDNRVLLSVALATAFAEVVGGWSETPRFLLNMPYYDREDVHPDIGRIVGDFTNVVLVPVDVGDDRPFADSVRRVQAVFHEHVAHGSYTGVDVLRDLLRRDPDAGPPAPVVFTTAINLGELFDDGLRRCLGAPGYTMSTTPQVLLDCQVTVRGGGLFVNWDAVEEVFPAGVLDAMFGAYVTLLDRLVAGAWADPVGALLPAGHAAVRAEVNATATPSPAALLHDGVFGRAAREPDRPALLAAAGTWSYGELADRALRVAGWLAERGVRPGDTVCVCVPRGPAQVAAVLGVLAAGGAYVPVGVDQPAARRERIQRLAGVRHTLTEQAVEQARDVAPLPGPLPIEPHTLAYVIYTSGSTGEPKGVEVTHAAAMNTVAAVNRRFGVGEADRVLALSALDFDLSVYDIFGLLGAGGSMVLVAEEDRREAAVWVDLARRHGVTIWNSVPALLDMALVAGAARLGWARRLRLALLSGDWVGLDLPGRLREQAEGCRFVALGGATEAAIWSNAQEVDSVPGDWRSVPYGRPLPNQRFRVVDGRGRDCPDWVAGELWIGGAGVALGYRGDQQRTAAQFVTSGGRRWYRTGDLGRYWPDGTLEFLGRRDSQVKIGGHRIELGEIEAALAGHPEVAAAVAVVTDRPGRQLAVAITPVDQDRPPTPEQLHRHCAEQLPGYMTPALANIRIVAALPLTANGKVDRAALTEGMSPAAAGRSHQPPSGRVETTLADLWAELLGRAPIGRADNFFTLGGDSLLATRLLARLRAAGLGGGRLPSLFAHPVLAEFAATLRPEATPAQTPLGADPANRWEPFPPTDVQRAYWMGRTGGFELGAVGSHWYWELDGAGVDLERLAAAWNRLVARHEMLRVVFDEDGNQRIQPVVGRLTIPVTDAPADAPAGALAALRAELSHRVADPASWPLNEIRAVRYGQRTRLAFSFDYIALDALSIVIVFTELSRLYADPGTELPPAEMSFRDYVLLGGADDAELERARRYWLAQIAELPPAPRLPLAKDPAAVRAPRFTRWEATLPSQRWTRLLAAAQRHAVTPAAALAAAFAAVLGTRSARADLTLNLTLFDRRPVHPGVNTTLGDFTSLLLAPYRPRPGAGFADLVLDYQKTIWAGMEHRAVSAIWVMRERARTVGPAEAAMPVVFTSALGLPSELVDVELPFGQPVFGLSQTPQVWLDCQVTVRGGGLVVSWDAVRELFPPGLLDAMFDAYVRVVDSLVDGDWTAPLPLADRPGADPPATRPVRRAAPAPHQPPVGDTEIVLAELWSRLLGRAPIGRADNFFTLGGDSILATALVEAIRGDLAAPMSLRALLDAPTLAELAEAVDTGAREAAALVEEGVV
ncbi:non-ribosomal peptide synthetase [Solihabitans fulvus]|uniref:non-ribosomal peptide synthetase n=1 Tax=Solihabitans fulvus TaxID=1892852 RepID=UPI0016619413|nr:non-ribosomal peptide synthetase [Solihabitans fulvus]